jgi:hypothetical protein
VHLDALQDGAIERTFHAGGFGTADVEAGDGADESFGRMVYLQLQA